MRFIAILLVLMAFMGAASAASSDVAGVYNKNLVGAVITIPAAETSDTNQIVNNASLNSTTNLLIRSTGVGSTNFLDDPDVPRCLIVTPHDAVTPEIKFTGLDISGAVITENLTFTASSDAQTTTKIAKPIPMKRELKLILDVGIRLCGSDCKAYPDEKGIETV